MNSGERKLLKFKIKSTYILNKNKLKIIYKNVMYEYAKKFI